MVYKNRKIIVFLAIVFAMFMLTAKIFYFQTGLSEKFLSAAVSQRTKQLPVKTFRGDILDANNIKFTNRENSVALVLKPELLRNNKELIYKISDILSIDYKTLNNSIVTSYKPILIEIDELEYNLLKVIKTDEFSLLQYEDRYNSNSLARHIIGYLNTDAVGESGVEKVYENILNCGGGIYIGTVANAKNQYIDQEGYRLFINEGDEKFDVKLTLDYYIQDIVETIMDIYKISGAIVVERVDNGDIAAIASRPDFEQDRIAEYVNNDNNSLFNKAVAGYMPGSIFKIITACAAIEKGIPVSVEYNCSGYIDIGDKDVKCSSYYSGGHGYIDMMKAFYYSCNTYFIKTGLKIGPDEILNMASNFGVGNSTGLSIQGFDESSGYLPLDETLFYGDTANISIGQGKLLLTPLQAADISATIANGGIKNNINLVDCVINTNNDKVKNCKYNQGKRIIDWNTAKELKEMMKNVVLNGTGKNAGIIGYGGTAGKTGSAETGKTIEGREVIHAWFTGFFPADNPKYSMCVFIEDGESGGKSAAPIFAEIAVKILEHNVK